MLSPKFNTLPEWKDSFSHHESGEEWKWKEDLECAEALYDQWREVFGLVMAFCETLPLEEEDAMTPWRFIYENAYAVAPKIISAAGDTLFQVKMENAAIIRFNCRQMWEQIAFAVLKDDADEPYKKVIEEALEKFRVLFREWVSTFRKDDMEDEWGLF